MTVAYTWVDDDRTICRCTLHDAWTWDEFYQARSAFRSQMAPPDRVDVILRVMPDAELPHDFMCEFYKSVSTALHSWELTVVVDAPLHYQLLLHAFKRSVPDMQDHFVFCPDEARALQIIADHRGTHPAAAD